MLGIFQVGFSLAFVIHESANPHIGEISFCSICLFCFSEMVFTHILDHIPLHMFWQLSWGVFQGPLCTET